MLKTSHCPIRPICCQSVDDLKTSLSAAGSGNMAQLQDVCATVNAMAEPVNPTGRFPAVPIPRTNPPDGASTKVAKRSPRDSNVCVPCKRAKLRCNRRLPCSSCARKGDPGACVYHRANATSRADAGNPQVAAEDRILHLESLVKQLMDSQASSKQDAAPAASHTPPSLPSDPLPPDQEEYLDEASYVGNTHWSAILDDIQELKDMLSAPTSTPRTPATTSSTAPLSGHGELIFGSTNDYSLDEILSQYLPSRQDVDRLLATYFQSETFIIPFIHSRQFQRKYREFWETPTAAHPLWTSILFSLCCIANLIRGAQEDNPSQGDLKASISSLHTAAGQCLVLGEYHRPQRMSVEALGLYAQCKNLWTLDPSREAGAILSIAFRMAFELGYHRDPDQLGNLSAFEGEMRRRSWTACKQMELMISFQLGLPSTICLDNADCRPPSNLLDSDFDEHTGVLPPSRPETETTQLLWLIVKDRQMPCFSKVCQDVLSFREKSEAEILQLDQEVQQMYDTIPDALRTRPMSASFADGPFMVMTRLYLEYICLKSSLVLHRRYMTRGNAHSTQACVQASRRLVTQFLEIYEEFAPGGQLYAQRWMLTNFTMNDFLLGVMTLCLIVHVRRKSLRWGQEVLVDASTETVVIGLLEQSYGICKEKSSQSKDASRVARAIRLITNGGKTSAISAPTVTAEETGASSSNTVDMMTLSLEPQDDPLFLTPVQGYTETLDPFNFIGADFAGIDWMSLEPLMFDTSNEGG